MVACVFPGQGSQYVGMGTALASTFPEAKNVFEEVEDVLKKNIFHVMANGPRETLNRTSYAQPALMATSIAVMRVLQSKMDFFSTIKVFAGHSLGEYSALVASGALSLERGVFLLGQRSEAMEKACPQGGAMMAILGLTLEEVESVVLLGQEKGVCVVANDNCLGQVVISGHQGAVEFAGEQAKKQGAKRCVLLDVSGPFHSPLMEPAQFFLEKVLHNISLTTPLAPIVPNITAQPETNPQALKACLPPQVVQKVRWRETLVHLHKEPLCLEIGSGTVLSRLGKRQPPCPLYSNLETAEHVTHYLRQQ